MVETLDQTWEIEGVFGRLRRMAASPNGARLFVRFQNRPWLTRHYRPQYGSVSGWYMYPIHTIAGWAGHSGFASERRWMLILRARPDVDIIRLDRNAPKAAAERARRLMKRVCPDRDQEGIGQTWRSIWLALDRCAARMPPERTMALYASVFGRRSIVVDPGSGIIHPAEPEQAVAFSADALEVVDVVRNPFGLSLRSGGLDRLWGMMRQVRRIAEQWQQDPDDDGLRRRLHRAVSALADMLREPTLPAPEGDLRRLAERLSMIALELAGDEPGSARDVLMGSDCARAIQRAEHIRRRIDAMVRRERSLPKLAESLAGEIDRLLKLDAGCIPPRFWCQVLRGILEPRINGGDLSELTLAVRGSATSSEEWIRLVDDDPDLRLLRDRSRPCREHVETLARFLRRHAETDRSV